MQQYHYFSSDTVFKFEVMSFEFIKKIVYADIGIIIVDMKRDCLRTVSCILLRLKKSAFRFFICEKLKPFFSFNKLHWI